jgi:hypothetical protein
MELFAWLNSQQTFSMDFKFNRHGTILCFGYPNANSFGTFAESRDESH